MKLDVSEVAPRLRSLNNSRIDVESSAKNGAAIFVRNIPILVPEAKSGKQDWILNDSRFAFMRKGNLTLPLCEADICVPVYQDDDMSIIAYTLMSKDYHEQVLAKM
jgi:hypothetical protein